MKQRQAERMAAGFPGQRMLVLPRPIVRSALADEVTSQVLVTDIGYFPHAAGHYRQRPTGAEQAIVIACVQGQGWAQFEGKRIDVHASQVLIVPAGRAHVYAADASKPWTIYWMHVAGKSVDPICQALSACAGGPILRLGDCATVVHLFDRAFDLLASSFTRTHLLSASLCASHLLGELLHQQRSAQFQTETAAERVEQAIELMKNHLGGKLTLKELAAAVNLSASHFSSLFRQRTGISPLHYFSQLKMRHACHLMDTTPLSIKAIAQQVGFADQLYFSRQFRAVYEMSPREYRAIKKG